MDYILAIFVPARYDTEFFNLLQPTDHYRHLDDVCSV